MTANQLPGQTLEPVPPSSEKAGDDEWSTLQKIVELSRLLWGGETGLPQDDEFTLWQKFNRNAFNA